MRTEPNPIGKDSFPSPINTRWAVVRSSSYMTEQRLTPPGDGVQSACVRYHGGWAVLTPWKYVEGNQSMFWPPKISHSFIQNCCWITASFTLSRMKYTCQNWKVKPIFRRAWNSLMAWRDWPWPPAPYLHYITYKFITRHTCQFASESGALRWRQNDYT